MGKIVVLEPVAIAKSERAASATRPESLEGKRIGLLWNAKPNGDAILEGVARVLAERGLTIVEQRFKKAYAMHEAGSELIAEVARSADVVVNAVAD